MSFKNIRSLLRSTEINKIEEGLKLAKNNPTAESLINLYRSIWKMTYANSSDPDITNNTSLNSLAGKMALMNEQEDLIPAEFDSIEMVESLDLGGFPEAVFFPELLQYKNLKTIEFWDNDMPELADDFFKITTLENLYICDGLKTLSPLIGNLKQLKSLNLNGNQINTVPTEIASLEKLELLDLSFNEIKDFSVDIKKLKNLKTLVLKDNPDLKLSDELIEYCQNNQIELLH
ncbi:MAG: hypothetical protein MI810_11465 [Flavobacteriales bacterium]|nr:hypothetical protein [Flavobacteriales bacterium]